jgi:hypothetical protein
MNRYILIRRLMGPSILLLLGVVALLSQAHVAHFYIFFPLLLILIGVLKLAERAALAADGGFPPPPQPWGAGPYPGAPQPPGPGVSQPNSASGTSIISAPLHDFGNHSEGDRS